MRTRSGVPVAVVMLALVGLASCVETNGLGVLDEGEESPSRPEYTGPGVNADISVGPVYGGLQDLTVTLEYDQYRLSSYQASMLFSPSVGRLERYSLPSTDYHVVNDGDASSGRVRFAGYAVDGFAGSVVLTFTFSVQKPLEPSDASVQFEAFGSAFGVPAKNSQVSLVGNMVAGGGR